MVEVFFLNASLSDFWIFLIHVSKKGQTIFALSNGGINRPVSLLLFIVVFGACYKSN